MKAGDSIAVGEVVCEYRGDLVTAREGTRREKARDGHGMAYAMWFQGRMQGQREGEDQANLW